MHKQSMTRNYQNLKRSLRNELPMKKSNYWKKLQNCLQVHILGRRNWYNPLFAFGRVQPLGPKGYSKKCRLFKIQHLLLKLNGLVTWKNLKPKILRILLLSKVERKIWRGFFRNVHKKQKWDNSSGAVLKNPC